MKSTTLTLLLAVVSAVKMNEGIHSFEEPKAEEPKAEGAAEGNATEPVAIPLDNTTKAESAKAAAAAIRK